MKNHPINLDQLQASLYYLHVHQLKVYCKDLGLADKGTKVALIERIIHFLKTGQKITLAKYPATSIARGKTNDTPHPNALMLKGTYKNDLKTRHFFKSLIGDHFHFTAFGIDWLEQRWMDGNPPTYQQFADMWRTEYKLRKIQGSTPKAAWAYINFVKSYLQNHPQAPRNETLRAWETARAKHTALVQSFFDGRL